MPIYRTWAERLDGYAQPGTVARAWADFYLGAVLMGEDQFAPSLEYRVRAFEQARTLGDRDLLWYWEQSSLTGSRPAIRARWRF